MGYFSPFASLASLLVLQELNYLSLSPPLHPSPPKLISPPQWTRISKLLLWNGDQLSRNFAGLQHQTGTTEVPCPVDWVTTVSLPGRDCYSGTTLTVEVPQSQGPSTRFSASQMWLSLFYILLDNIFIHLSVPLENSTKTPAVSRTWKTHDPRTGAGARAGAGWDSTCLARVRALRSIPRLKILQMLFNELYTYTALLKTTCLLTLLHQCLIWTLLEVG